MLEENLLRLTQFYVRIETSHRSPAFKDARRSWTERLFTLPWIPWASTKKVKNMSMIIDRNGTLYVSPEIKDRIYDILLDKPISTV